MLEKQRKPTLQDMIDKSSAAAARAVVNLQRQKQTTNLYKATERLLRNYKRLQEWENDPESYGFFPAEKSKDISVAPPPGSGVRDKLDMTDEFVSARRRSFERTMAHYYDIKAAISQFVDQREFIVIRMYYFNEDVHGHEREPGARRYTFEDIASELSSIGEVYSVKTLRTWRTKLVQDMTVLLFGVDGAVSIESHEPKQKEDTEQKDEAQ